MSLFQGSETSESYRVTRLRNDSYLGAIHKENLLVRAGLQVCHGVLLTHENRMIVLKKTVADRGTSGKKWTLNSVGVFYSLCSLVSYFMR
jgi:hypothetical protein